MGKERVEMAKTLGSGPRPLASHLPDQFAPHFAGLSRVPQERRCYVPSMRTSLGHSSKSLEDPCVAETATVWRLNWGMWPLKRSRSAPCYRFMSDTIGSNSLVLLLSFRFKLYQIKACVTSVAGNNEYTGT